MSKTFRLITAAFLCLLIVACSKEKSFDPDGNGGGGGSASGLAGQYKFINLHVKGISTVTVPAFDSKTISFFEYTTKNNSGMVTITNTDFTYKGLSYSVDTVFKTYLYDGADLVDSFDLPMQANMPNVDVTSPYKYIAPDSIYYPGGSPMSMGDNTVTTIANGARFRFENDKLIVVSPIQVTKTETQQGVTQTLVSNVVSTATLQKQ